MHRVTVLKARRRFVAEVEMEVRDPRNAAHIEAAGRDACKARGRSFPNPAIVRVEEKTGGGRWRQVSERVI